MYRIAGGGRILGDGGDGSTTRNTGSAILNEGSGLLSTNRLNNK
jgi:hypothetical protein